MPTRTAPPVSYREYSWGNYSCCENASMACNRLRGVAKKLVLWFKEESYGKSVVSTPCTIAEIQSFKCITKIYSWTGVNLPACTICMLAILVMILVQTLMFGDATDIRFTFIHFLGSGIYLTSNIHTQLLWCNANMYTYMWTQTWHAKEVLLVAGYRPPLPLGLWLPNVKLGPETLPFGVKRLLFIVR